MIPVRGNIGGVQETQSAISQIPSLLVQAGQAGMREALELLSKTVRERFLRGPYPENIERHSGSFAATFARGHKDNIWEVQVRGQVIHGTFGSRDIRASILDQGTSSLPGGVLKPKRGQFLAIPAKAVLTPTGQLRSQYAAARTSWRNVPGTFIGGRGIRRGGEGLYIAERIGRGRIRVLAWLVRSVYFKGRRFMAKTQAAVEPQLPALFQKRVDQLAERLNATLARFRG